MVIPNVKQISQTIFRNCLACLFLERRFSTKKYSPVSHVLFDLDGTLLDTEKIYAQLYKNILVPYRREYTKEDHLALAGLNTFDRCRSFIERFQLPLTFEEVLDQLQRNIPILMSNVELKPGAERLVRHLSKNQVPFAIATSGSPHNFQIKTANHSQLFSLFNHVVFGFSDPEVLHGKPAPDVFLVAAKRFPKSPHPKECLVFEDSVIGVTAAKAAGMQVVMIPEQYCPEEKTKDATLVIRSLEEFEPDQFGLPAYPKH